MKRTSDYLQSCLDEPRGEAVPRMVELRASTLKGSVGEWFDGVLLGQFMSLHNMFESGRVRETEKGTIAEGLDHALCRHFVSNIPSMVERLLKFDLVITEGSHNEEVRIYFQQATYCYVLGLSVAAVAVARACLEQALREEVPYAEGLDLQALIGAAGKYKKLDGAHIQMARVVQRIGNKVLHKKACSDSEALESIDNVRAVVEHLYGPSDIFSS